MQIPIKDKIFNLLLTHTHASRTKAAEEIAELFEQEAPHPAGAEWVKAKPVNNGFYAVKYAGGGYGGCGFKDGEWNQSLNDSLIIAYLDESPSKEGNKEREIAFAEWAGLTYYWRPIAKEWGKYDRDGSFTSEQLWNEWNNQQSKNK